MRIEFLCISVLRVASGARVKLVSCKSALTRLSPTPLRPIVYSTDHSKAVVRCWSNSLMLCGLFYEAICFMSYLVLFILFLCFSVLLALRLPRLGKRELTLVLLVRVFDLCFLVLLVSSSSWCLGRAAVCDCGTPWNFYSYLFCGLSWDKRGGTGQTG